MKISHLERFRRKIKDEQSIQTALWLLYKKKTIEEYRFNTKTKEASKKIKF